MLVHVQVRPMQGDKFPWSVCTLLGRFQHRFWIFFFLHEKVSVKLLKSFKSMVYCNFVVSQWPSPQELFSRCSNALLPASFWQSGTSAALSFPLQVCRWTGISFGMVGGDGWLPQLFTPAVVSAEPSYLQRLFWNQYYMSPQKGKSSLSDPAYSPHLGFFSPLAYSPVLFKHDVWSNVPSSFSAAYQEIAHDGMLPRWGLQSWTRKQSTYPESQGSARIRREKGDGVGATGTSDAAEQHRESSRHWHGAGKGRGREGMLMFTEITGGHNKVPH